MKKMQNVTLTQPVISVAMREQILGTHRRKQVGLFGGTFNPIHNGHLIMAEAAGTELGLEKVYFMPDNMPPHVDTKTAISARHRVNMVQLAIADNPLLGWKALKFGVGALVTRIKPCRSCTDFIRIRITTLSSVPTWLTIYQSGRTLMNW